MSSSPRLSPQGRSAAFNKCTRVLKEGYCDHWEGVPCALAASGHALTLSAMQGLVRRRVHTVLYSTPGKRKGDFMSLRFCGAREKEEAPSLGSRGEDLPGAPAGPAPTEGVGYSCTWAKISVPKSASRINLQAFPPSQFYSMIIFYGQGNNFPVRVHL